MHDSPALRDWLARCPLIAILRGIETSDVDDIFSELLSAGILIAEIPLNYFPTRCWSAPEL
jgi:2-dehydro-3-deoxyphosphogalactonate aldolase